MYADVERFRPGSGEQYLRVLHQQGRVFLAAEANEQVAILVHYLRTLAIDLTGGGSGTGGGESIGPGFAVVEEAGELRIRAGHYWVEGYLCELGTRTPVSAQPLLDLDPSVWSGRYLVYLDVWERHVSAAERPELLETALGGPDTSSRTQIAWQAHAVKVDDDPTEPADADARALADTALASLVAARAPSTRGLLTARRDPDGSGDQTGYAAGGDGENQLLRVEIHTPDEYGLPTFKWAWDNASTVYRLRSVNGTVVVLEAPPRHRRRDLAVGTCVEVLTGSDVRLRRSGRLTRIESIEDDEDLRLTLTDTVDVDYPPKDIRVGEHWAVLRRWDHPADDRTTNGAVRLTEEQPVLLGAGVKVEFSPPPAGPAGAWAYQTGDYWTIPVRVNAPHVIWPQAESSGPGGTLVPAAVPPDGVEHCYASLALTHLTAGQPQWVVDVRTWLGVD